ncbi:C45 family autoproteolytic acyltransferase/hydolase [Jannaschia seohaensis]|uniref:Predicted choloylglycine hydrolase n=1 Tax=Jannaschia seohaensis TaxID=475081 RepID=A0A2Y9AG55_9RHOB|nr:C45 family peptidase [Jannaschia seohaensis]PWJ21129.1 putative choloylglycine hydrolase [Jannaschia seohaensis]SSA41539.1 Predicted choloylglycine hydrolase [Jannaschia seohaensis]
MFRAVSEDSPGPKWAALFNEYWPAYRRWWSREGLSGRPTYRESLTALRTHMPEIVPLYEELCELVGGGDSQARFLSYYCPPRYLAGCSQAIWPGEEPLLVRNYDYDVTAFDAVLLKTRWQGRGVMGMADGLFGLVDGMNDAGLAVSLTFGGRRAVGEGFGVPLILRYILQTCETAEEAGRVLERVPCHMSYNVTVLDARRRYLTAYLAPDRPTVLSHAAVATNHQDRVEWQSHARLTATVERERFLLHRLTLHPETPEKFIASFLRPPLYSVAFGEGFGTLYTAAYRPKAGQMDVMWPGSDWRKSFDHFEEGVMDIVYPMNARV